MFPTRLDNGDHPPTKALRYIAKHLGHIEFHAFSVNSGDVVSREDWVWQLPNVKRVAMREALFGRYDIVHMKSATRPALYLSALHSKRFLRSAKWVFTASIELDVSDANYKNMLYAARRADLVTAISNSVSDSMMKLGIGTDFVTPNGVDTEFFSPRPEDRRNYPNQVAFIGVLSDRKRFPFVLELARYMPDVLFAIVGRPEGEGQASELQVLMSRLSNVRWFGHVPPSGIRDVLAASRALLFPSVREGYPSAVLEALSMGLPVIAQPKSSLPELISDNITGLLREEGLSEWDGAIRSVLGLSEEAFAAWSREIRRVALSRFSWERAVEAYESAYAAVLGQ